MGKIKVDGFTALQTQISALSKQLGNLTHKANSASTEFQGEQCNMLGNVNDKFVLCNTRNFGENCVEQANYVGNQFQGRQGNNLYSNTCNPGWRNHPNFSWSTNNNVAAPNFPNNINVAKNQGPPGFPQPQ